MWKTENRIEVVAPRETVYEQLADLCRHKEWSVGVEEIEQTAGDGPGIGAEYRAREVVPGRFTSYSRITRLEPPRLIEWRSWDGRTMQADWSFELTGGEGSTLVVQRAVFRPSLLGQVVTRVLRRRTRTPRENAESLQRLRAAIESTQDGSPSQRVQALT